MHVARKFRLPPMPSISEIVKLYKLSAKKKLSQNFLLDKNINDKIIRAAGVTEGAFVMEIGPGPGGITRSAIEAGAKKICVVEKDLRFMPGLQLLAETVEPHGVDLQLYHSDALTFPMGNNIDKEQYQKPWDSDELPNAYLVGNLPFNIATPLLFKLLLKVANKSGIFACGRVPMTFMFQQEFGERMICPAGFHERARVSVMCQYLCDVDLKFLVKNTAFVPQPKVNAAVMKLVPLKNPRIMCNFDTVSKVVKATFQFKNKHWFVGTKTLFPAKYPEFIVKFNELCKVNKEKLPIDLDMIEIDDICMAYHQIIEIFPELDNYDYRHNQSL